MNNLHTIGPIYWVLKDNATNKTPRLAMAFMRQTDFPWRVGRGIQLKMNNYSFQIGLSKKTKTTDDLGELDVCCTLCRAESWKHPYQKLEIGNEVVYETKD